MTTVMLTSYEIVWATARILPKDAYLLFLLQPAPRVPYTERLLTATTKTNINFKSDGADCNGKTLHNIIGMHIIKIETLMKILLLLREG